MDLSAREVVKERRRRCVVLQNSLHCVANVNVVAVRPVHTPCRLVVVPEIRRVPTVSILTDFVEALLRLCTHAVISC